MALETFNFCPNSLVPETLPREVPSVLTMNGWTFTSRPTTPHQRKFRVKLFGLRWFLDDIDDTYDDDTLPTINARALEEFYARHETWAPFNWTHPHLGPLVVRFAAPVTVPAATANSGGLLEPLEITLIHHNPGYA